MDRKKQLQSAPVISLLDEQTVGSHPLIVSSGMTKIGVALAFLITICAICHIDLHCRLFSVVITGPKTKRCFILLVSLFFLFM